MLPDKEEILARWRESGEPAIPLPTGGEIYDLNKYLDFYGYPDFENAIHVVRRYLGMVEPEPLMVSPED